MRKSYIYGKLRIFLDGVIKKVNKYSQYILLIEKNLYIVKI